MGWIFYIIGILCLIILFILLLSFVCFLIVFYEFRPKNKPLPEHPIPRGKIYEPYRDLMIGWQNEARALSPADFNITSFDGLNLHAQYFEYQKGAPMEIMFHGYRGSAMRDLCGGIKRAFAVGRNVLLVDQRTSGGSDGHIITFGIKEHKDALSWIDFAVNYFGPNVKIILTGISMGASTVILASGYELPSQVVGILADCGYSSAEKIIKKIIRQLHLPMFPTYQLIKTGAKLWGGLDIESLNPVDAIKNCKLPIFFAHGDNDDFVPCEMSKENYDACTSPKHFMIVPGAGHGLAYAVEPQRYLEEMAAFYSENGIPTEIVTKSPTMSEGLN